MYAVIKSGGKQYRVLEGETLQVDRLKAEIGARLELPVLLIGGDTPKVGAPLVEGASVQVTVVSHDQGTKITALKYRRRKRTRRRFGSRASLTTLKIDKIEA
jgi:large subunit ribosomal protein L21